MSPIAGKGTYLLSESYLSLDEPLQAEDPSLNLLLAGIEARLFVCERVGNSVGIVHGRLVCAMIAVLMVGMIDVVSGICIKFLRGLSFKRRSGCW